MQLRHIRPRSVDWYDATFEEDERRLQRLSPEEKMKLRRMGQPEPAQLAPLIHGGASPESHPAPRTVL
jgi:hypothetical protein